MAGGDAGLRAAIDLGAAKTLAVIGRREGAGWRVAGFGLQAPLLPPRDGEDAVRRARVAIEDAERMAQTVIAEAIAVYGGPGARARIILATAPASGAIDSAQVRRALAKAREQAASPERTALHVSPLAYRIDDGPWIADPRGQTGRRLTVRACAVTVPQAALAALAERLGEAGVQATGFVAAAHAAGLAALSDAERIEGAALIDLGAETTGLAVFEGGALIALETFAVGQRQATAALAQRFNTSLAAAERAKRAHAAFEAASARADRVEIARFGEDGRLEPCAVPRGDIAEAVAATLEQTLAPVRRALEQVGGRPTVALAGGGARLPGLAGFVSSLIGGLDVRVAAVGDEALDGAGPDCVAAIGALALTPVAAPAARARPAIPVAAGPAAKALAWLRENF